MPVEIRNKIWKIFVPSGRIFKISLESKSKGACKARNTKDILRGTLLHDTRALFTCKEAFYVITNPGTRSLFFKDSLVKPIMFNPATDLLWFTDDTSQWKFMENTWTGYLPDRNDVTETDVCDEYDHNYRKSMLIQKSQNVHTVVFGDSVKDADGNFRAKPLLTDDDDRKSLMFQLCYMGTLQKVYFIVEDDDNESQEFVQAMREFEPHLEDVGNIPPAVIKSCPAVVALSWKEFKAEMANWTMEGELQEFKKR